MNNTVQHHNTEPFPSPEYLLLPAITQPASTWISLYTCGKLPTEDKYFTSGSLLFPYFIYKSL